jgi:hypothetical protein
VILIPLALALFAPVDGAVTRPFHYGADPYAPGQHRGVDLRARPGARVVAACAGEVVAAGEVAGTGVVSLRCGRHRVSHLPLTAIAVEPGARVAAGESVGLVAAGHPGLHLGVREEGDGSAYRDPAPLLGAASPPTLPAVRPAPPVRPPKPPRKPPPKPPGGPKPAPPASPGREPRIEPPRVAPRRAPSPGWAQAGAASPAAAPVPAAPPAAPWPAYLGLGLAAAAVTATTRVHRRRQAQLRRSEAWSRASA